MGIQVDEWIDSRMDRIVEALLGILTHREEIIKHTKEPEWHTTTAKGPHSTKLLKITRVWQAAVTCQLAGVRPPWERAVGTAMWQLQQAGKWHPWE